MRKRLIAVLALVLAFAAIGAALTYAGGNGARDSLQQRSHRMNVCPGLTEEQRAELRQKVNEMKGAGATREDIRAGVGEMLQQWGIEPPESLQNCRGSRPGLFGGIFAGLTDEQRTEIREKVSEMKEVRASREEIHAAVGDMLREWGIELPEGWNECKGPGPGAGGLRHLGAGLTEEQRTAIREMVREMKEAGASREEIRNAVREMLGQDNGTTEPSAKLTETSAIQPSSWGEIKHQFK